VIGAEWWASSVQRLAVAVVVAIGLLASCGGGDDPPDETATTPSTSDDKAATVLVYIRPAEFQTDDLDHMMVERLGGTSADEVETPDGLRVASPDVSADGRRVVYLTWTDEAQSTGDIWVSPLTKTGGGPTRITDASEEWWCPRWMPDSQHLLAFRDGPVAQLAVIDSETGDLQVVQTGMDVDEMAVCADPSPSGGEVAVARDTPRGQNEVWSIPIDGGQERLLGALPEDCTINDVAWSPAEGLIATDAICESRNYNGIWLVATDGAAPTQLVGENAEDSPMLASLQYWEPAWSPSGDRVFFHRHLTTQYGDEPDPPSVWQAEVQGGSPKRVTQPGALSPSAGPA
jgi:Tol biopolymer transport system component